MDQQETKERARVEARLRLHLGQMLTAAVTAALVVIIAVVALLGGFRTRTDLSTRVPAGTIIATGPYEVTLATATSQDHTSDNTWTVVVSGTARTTGTTSIAPGTGDSGFAYARNASGGSVEAANTTTLGIGPTVYPVQGTLTPGLPAVPWAMTFRFPASPDDNLLVAVFQQEYTTSYLFSDQERGLTTGTAATTLLEPRRLPGAE